MAWSSLFPWGDPPCSFRVWSSCILFCNAQSPSDRPLSPRHPVQSIHSIRRLSLLALPSPLQKEEARRRDAEGEAAILHHHQQLQPLAIAATGLQDESAAAATAATAASLADSAAVLLFLAPVCNPLQRLCFGRLQLFFSPASRTSWTDLVLPQLLPPVPQPHLTTGPSPDCGIHLQPRDCSAGASSSSSSSFLSHTTLLCAVSSPVALPSVCWDRWLLASLLVVSPSFRHTTVRYRPCRSTSAPWPRRVSLFLRMIGPGSNPLAGSFRRADSGRHVALSASQ